ncbi:MAG TPA: hypothetical protein VIK95_11690 [Egibacteraceae bacterium]
MAVQVVRYTMRDGAAAAVRDGIAEMMTGIEQAQPTGIGYTIGTLPDGVTVVGVLELRDGAENPLPAIPAARAYQQRLADWVVGEPPVPQPVQVLGSYRRWD